ncbi:MFS transporter, partial [Stackebrandtia soli]|uniref:MFS transporter n=1 Tax=Stackebrandtia soli TaxID=1892856 RepID=UPI0039E816AA
MKSILSNRSFRFMFTGMVAGIIGDSLLLITLAIWVKDLTGSDGAAGLTMFFLGAPYLMAPLAGWLVDRLPFKPFLVVANLLNILVLLPLAFVSGVADVWMIYLVAFMLGVGGVVDTPAVNGLLKLLLPDDQLVDANGLSQTVRQGMRLLGPIIGAGIYMTAGGFAVAILDAVCFVIAAAMFALVAVEQPRREPSGLAWRAEISAGFRFLAKEKALLRAVSGMFIAAWAIGAIESVGFAIADKGLGQPSEFISVIVTAMGVGGIIGGVLAARIVRRFGELGSEGAGLLCLATAFLLWSIPSIPVVLGSAALAGFALPVVIVADNTLIQRRSPKELIGRVSA